MAERWSTRQTRAWPSSAECSHLCRLAADKEIQYPGLARIICSGVAEFLEFGDAIVTADLDGRLRFVEAGSGQVQLDVKLSEDSLYSAAWSPDGGLVATAGLDGRLRVVEAGSGQVQLDVRLSEDSLLSAAWSPDGGLVATAGADGRLCVVEAGSGQVQLDVELSKSALSSVAWEPLRLFSPSRAAARNWPGGSPASEPSRRGAAAAASVIDAIAHAEPAAALDEFTAALGGDIAWVEQVEQGLEPARLAEAEVTTAAAAATVPAEDPDPEARSGSGGPARGVYILRFGSPPRGGDSWERFREALLRAPQLHPHIKELPGGVPIIVEDEQYEDTVHALVGWQLQRYNVVIAEQLEYLLAEVLASLSYNRRPKLKQGARGRLQLAGSSAAASPETRARGSSSDEAQDFAASAGGDEEADILWLLRAKHTFLTYAPAPRPARTVAQSTTEVVAQSEAHYGSYRGNNPRRLRHDELS